MEQQSANGNAVVGRASGGLFMSLFGGLWIGLGTAQWLGTTGWVLAMLGAGALALACLRLKRLARPHMAVVDSAARRAVSRRFFYINLMQWGAIFVAAQVLASLKLQAWVLPAVMAIVGLHFLPLVRLFQYRAHLWTGLALLAWALIYPWLGGTAAPQSAVGPVGTGLILWLSVVWVLWCQRGWFATPGAVPAR
jgi:hypothetical protein